MCQIVYDAFGMMKRKEWRMINECNSWSYWLQLSITWSNAEIRLALCKNIIVVWMQKFPKIIELSDIDGRDVILLQQSETR